MTVIRRDSTVDKVTDALMGEILGGRLVPGEHLREEEFAARFEVSRNTLREACHRLAHEGLVVHRPHRGVTVTRPDAVGVAEIFRVRRALEATGLSIAGEKCVADLLHLADEMERAADENEWTRLVDADLDFHARLVAAIESPRLDAFFAALLRELRLSLVLIDSAGGEPARPSHVPDHRRIAVQLGRGAVDAARDGLLKHLRSAERLVLRHLEDAVETAATGR